MKKRILIFGIFFIILFLNFLSAATVECDSCESCNTAISGASSEDVVLLNTSISDYSGYSCIDFGSSVQNITFDCQGNTIDGDGTPNYGIYLERSGEVSNITIQNCIVKEFVDGIYLGISNNNTLKNITSSDNSQSGIYSASSSYNNLTNITVDSNSEGIYLHSSSNNLLINITSSNNLQYGIHLRWDSYYNTITNSTIENNSQGLYLEGNYPSPPIWPEYNLIYNNIFNNSINLDSNGNICIAQACTDTFNTTLTSGTNIVEGPYIGGNYWAYPNGTGFSETCTDADANGICDNSYEIYVGNVDYLPLADAPIIECDSCSSCNTAISGANSGDVIYLNTSISATGNCIVSNAKKNFIFDGQGYSITGDETGYGIYLNESSPENSNIILQNISVTNFSEGIHLDYSGNNTLTNMTSNLNSIGIYLSNSNNNTLTNITTNLNSQDGISLADSNNNTLTNITSNLNGGEGIVINSLNNTLTNIITNSNGYLFNGNGVDIYSSNNTLINITSLNNFHYGFYFLGDADFNTLINSTIENNSVGIYMQGLGSYALSVDYNVIYNNFLNNTINFDFSDSVGITYFNTTLTSGTNIVGGPFIGGNYWAHPNGTGYSELCNDTDPNDGICDEPYPTILGFYDYLPLTNYTDLTGPTISITYPTATSYTSVTSLNYTVSNLSDVNYCWYSLNGGVTNSTPDSSCENITGLTAAVGSHTWTVYANDSLGNENSDSVTFTISAVDDGGGGGGGGSSSTSTTSTSSITISSVNLVAGSSRILFVNKVGFDLTKITMTPNKIISNLALKITKLSTNSNLLSDLSSESIYQAFEINKTYFINEDIENVTFEFKVNKSWVEGKDVKKIILKRKEDNSNEWKILKTNLFNEDDNYYYFTAISSGFSTFVIYFDEEVCDVGDLVCVEGNLHLCTSERVLLLVQKCEFDCKYGRCIENYELGELEEGENVFQRFLKIVSNLRVNLGNVFFFAIIGFISIFFIIMFYLILRRKNFFNLHKKSKVKEDLNFN